MATPYSWPTTLPQPQKHFKTKTINGLTGESDDLYPERNKVDPDSEGSFSFVFTDSQYSIFENFYKNTINGGCASFSAGWIEDTGYEARFKEPYSASCVGGEVWLVSISVELFKSEI